MLWPQLDPFLQATAPSVQYTDSFFALSSVRGSWTALTPDKVLLSPSVLRCGNLLTRSCTRLPAVSAKRSTLQNIVANNVCLLRCTCSVLSSGHQKESRFGRDCTTPFAMPLRRDEYAPEGSRRSKRIMSPSGMNQTGQRSVPSSMQESKRSSAKERLGMTRTP